MSQPQSQSLVETHPTLSVGSLAAVAAPRVIIERVSPSVDAGRFPSKAVVGQSIVVEADIFIDGHEKPGAQVLWRSAGDLQTLVVPMRPQGNDRWRGEFTPTTPGMYTFTIEAWFDVWGSYRSDLMKNTAADKVTALEIEEEIGRAHV